MSKRITPPGYHPASQGEWLRKLCQDYGFADWRTIWNDPKNADLRKVRRPNLLHAGDLVWIPALRPREVPAPDGAKHAFKAKGKPDELTIVIEADKAKPNAGVAYAYTIAGAPRGSGSSGGDGKTKSPVPRLHDPATVKLGKEFVTLDIGHLNPLGDDTPDRGVSGVQARLNNLGLRAGREDGILGPRTARAITHFQKLEGIAPTGTITDDLRTRLLQRHGI
ncbi:MAG: peptidoglycan-binding domain-containing protein [Candidatus Krumholzibacteriia bacterium]